MDAGPEMDILILEKIFGFPRKKVFKTEWSADYYYIPSGKPRRTHEIDAKPVPRFSRDIAAAWEVVKHFYRAGCSAWVAMDGHTGSSAGCTSNRGRFEEWADTPELALCRAALRARGVEVE